MRKMSKHSSIVIFTTIVEKKRDASVRRADGIEPIADKSALNQPTQPSHAEDLMLKEAPVSFERLLGR
jgi:hypothetical protein